MTDVMVRNISSENERTAVGRESGARGKTNHNSRNRVRCPKRGEEQRRRMGCGLAKK
ncbi:hypothetical protein BDW75DRAFT_207465 [Aspergillus navahoensis]